MELKSCRCLPISITPRLTMTGFFCRPAESLYRIDNNTAMETLYRVNVGGRSILPSEDTGMFRGWSQDDDYFSAVHKNSAILSNTTIELKFTKVPPYTAPEDVYRTARTMGNDSIINKNYNLTWEFPVDSGFIYLVRLHFCEFQPEITQQHERVFLVFIANMTAEVISRCDTWSGGNGVPVYSRLRRFHVWQRRREENESLCGIRSKPARLDDFLQ
jgi:hypothetical protein